VSEQTSETRPTHCIDCSKPMESPICCTSCGALNPIELGSINYFDLFCVDQTYDLDEAELHDKYLCLSRTTHPDMVSRESQEMHKRALLLNAELNQAYDTLRDPVKRADYLLSLFGGPSPSEDKSVPGNLLGEVMELREEIEEAGTSGDTDLLHGLRKQITSSRRAVEERIASLARSINKDDTGGLKALRKQLNAIQYWNNLTEKFPADLATE